MHICMLVMATSIISVSSGSVRVNNFQCQRTILANLIKPGVVYLVLCQQASFDGFWRIGNCDCSISLQADSIDYFLKHSAIEAKSNLCCVVVAVVHIRFAI